MSDKTETKIEEIKEVILIRIPPGDKWQDSDNPASPILESLTDALEWYFQKTGETNFYLAAREGTVSVVKTEEVKVEKQIKTFSLYGED